jgi:co-chaperonin GroES (HSP10)
MVAIGRVIIIEPDKEVAEKTKGGILLLEKDKENIRYRNATVISVGDEIDSKVLSPGMRIKYDKHAGHGVEINKVDYKVIRKEDIIGVL